MAEPESSEPIDFVAVRDLAGEFNVTYTRLMQIIKKGRIELHKNRSQRHADGRLMWVVSCDDADRIRKERSVAIGLRRSTTRASLATVDCMASPPPGKSLRWHGYKVELDPNNNQRTMLARHAGCARKAWNWALDRKQEVYQQTGHGMSYFDLRRELTIAKKELFPYMSDVSSWATNNAIKRLDVAFVRFYRGISKFPKKKSRHRGRGSFDLSGRDVIVETKRIFLPRIGWVRLKRGSYVPQNARILSVTVREQSDRWFVGVQIPELHDTPATPVGAEVGVDLGISTFAVTSEGEYVQSPKPLAKSLKKLKRLCRRLSRKERGSKNRDKARRMVASLYFHISCQRSNFIHQLTSRLTKTKSLIAIEDLNVAGMMRGNCARGVVDAGWSEFRRQITYKCQWHGANLFVVDRYFASTKTCLKCGKTKEISLKERFYRCDDSACGFEMERDLKSAKSVLKEAQQQIRSRRPEYAPVEDVGRPTPEKQEPNIVSESTELVVDTPTL